MQVTDIKLKTSFSLGRNFNYTILEIPISLYKLMCQISLKISLSFLFCEFNRVASRNEGKTIILVRSLFQISK